MSIVTLTGETPINEPDPDVIAFFERYLERAKSGEIRAVAMAYVPGSGRPSYAYVSEQSEVARLTMSMALLRATWDRRLLAQCLDGEDQP